MENIHLSHWRMRQETKSGIILRRDTLFSHDTNDFEHFSVDFNPTIDFW